MTATHPTALIAHGQLPAPLEAATAQHLAAIFGLHPRQKAMLAPTWNSFRLPSSLWHRLFLLCARVRTLASYGQKLSPLYLSRYDRSNTVGVRGAAAPPPEDLCCCCLAAKPPNNNNLGFGATPQGLCTWPSRAKMGLGTARPSPALTRAFGRTLPNRRARPAGACAGWHHAGGGRYHLGPRSPPLRRAPCGDHDECWMGCHTC